MPDFTTVQGFRVRLLYELDYLWSIARAVAVIAILLTFGAGAIEWDRLAFFFVFSAAASGGGMVALSVAATIVKRLG